MDNELRYFLEQGPTTVKELARLTGKSTSTLYKSLKTGRESGEVIVHDDEDGGPTKFSVKPAETTVDGPGATVEEQAVPAPQKDDAVAPAQPKAEKRGRKATGAGKKLFPNTLGGDEPQTYLNPRRKNSHGYRSLQIIIDNPGITTEDYLAQGGRLNDLRWDIARDRVKLED